MPSAETHPLLAEIPERLFGKLRMSHCMKPDHRGQGLASRLMGALIAGIQRRSERAFLHVMSTNTGAIGLYEALGFRVRQHATLTVVTREPLRDAQT
jgi:GNAT superfamily N-acetyltransferase